MRGSHSRQKPFCYHFSPWISKKYQIPRTHTVKVSNHITTSREECFNIFEQYVKLLQMNYKDDHILHILVISFIKAVIMRCK